MPFIVWVTRRTHGLTQLFLAQNACAGVSNLAQSGKPNGGQMPTGYTHKIDDDPNFTFEQFAMGCARAMGACVDMRDEPGSAEIPKAFEVPAWYASGVRQAEAHLREVEGMTVQDATKASAGEHFAAHEGWERRRRDRLATLERYRSMAILVEAWKVPTPDHEGLKRFMLEQLNLCLGPLRYESEEPKVVPPGLWLVRKRKAAGRAVVSAKESLERMTELVAGRNKWIADLRASLTA